MGPQNRMLFTICHLRFVICGDCPLRNEGWFFVPENFVLKQETAELLRSRRSYCSMTNGKWHMTNGK